MACDPLLCRPILNGLPSAFKVNLRTDRSGHWKEVGLSRSALVERFTRYLSEPPMAYLMRWRLQLAARALAATSRGGDSIRRL